MATFGSTPALISSLEALKGMGCRIAVDDVGAGFSGLTRILETQPNIIKLDRSLISGIDQDHIRAALLTTTLGFAAAADCAVIAEGVETAEELRSLAELGVRYAQGYALARPAPFPLPTQPVTHRRGRIGIATMR